MRVQVQEVLGFSGINGGEYSRIYQGGLQNIGILGVQQGFQWMSCRFEVWRIVEGDFLRLEGVDFQWSVGFSQVIVLEASGMKDGFNEDRKVIVFSFC